MVSESQVVRIVAMLVAVADVVLLLCFIFLLSHRVVWVLFDFHLPLISLLPFLLPASYLPLSLAALMIQSNPSEIAVHASTFQRAIVPLHLLLLLPLFPIPSGDLHSFFGAFPLLARKLVASKELH